MFIGSSPNDSTKKILLLSPWKPTETYQFPVDPKRHLKFQLTWLKRYPWLVYSQKFEGAFCKMCVLFFSEHAGKGRHQPLKSFVLQPFTKWKDALEKFRDHEKSHHHKSATVSAENYLSVAQGTRANIIEQTVSGHTQQVAINRSKLVPIIKTIILCERQELSLRGTNDSGDVLAKSSQNDGNFRSFLRFRVDARDSALKKHLETAERNSLCTSPSIQNDIIAACGEVIKNTVVSKIKAAKCYSILADETTDISSSKQLTLCCRYFDDDAKKVCEDFLEFVPVYDVTGVGLAKVILNKVTQLSLDPNKIVGQGYDGAAAMSGHLNGVRAHISSKYPKALYVYCSAHSLNLAVSKSCSVPLLRNSLGTIGSVCTFLRSSPQRMQLFKQQVASHLPTANFSTLIPLSETRWVERHDSVLHFLKMYIPIVNTLQELEMSHNSSAAQQAHQ